MKYFRAILAIVAITFVVGCSDSTTPSNTYPLTLAIVSDSFWNNTALFNFRVTKNGAPLAGAKLRRTDFPTNNTRDLGIQSDSNGNFPRVILVLDTMPAVAYQAVRDTLSSNYIRWPQ